ncbi:MAG: hypothetical protein ACTIH8_02030, partial [Microbacterium gubbeenense]
DVSDRIELFIAFDSADEHRTFEQAGFAPIASLSDLVESETLSSFTPVFSDSEERGHEDLSSIDAWTSAHGFRPEHVNVVPAGTYANTADFTVAVARRGADR